MWKMFYTERFFLKLVIYVSKQTNNLLVCIRNITLMQIPKMGYNINPHASEQGNSLIQKVYQSLKITIKAFNFRGTDFTKNLSLYCRQVISQFCFSRTPKFFHKWFFKADMYVFSSYQAFWFSSTPPSWVLSLLHLIFSHMLKLEQPAPKRPVGVYKKNQELNVFLGEVSASDFDPLY